MNIPSLGDHCGSGDGDSDEQLRMATTTANKAHSWRGDHPMKNPTTGHYHHPGQLQNPMAAFHNPAASKYAAKSKSFNPYNYNMYHGPPPPPPAMGPPSAGGGPKPYHYGQQGAYVKQGPSSANPRSLPHGGVRLIGLANPQHHH